MITRCKGSDGRGLCKSLFGALVVETTLFVGKIRPMSGLCKVQVDVGVGAVTPSTPREAGTAGRRDGGRHFLHCACSLFSLALIYP